jgi:very-short-patch-repair endonuclease
MRFDFFLPELGILTEVDGRQHFQWVKKFHRTKQEFNHAK